MEDSPVLSQGDCFFSAIKHSRRNKSKESCGLFIYKNQKTQYDFLPLDNKYLDDPTFFSLDDQLFNSYYLNQNIICLFHSHFNCNENPSDLDIETSNSLGLPSMIYSLETSEFSLYYPESYKPPSLFGRIFIPFLQDCMIFAKDYYQIELNINLSQDIKSWSRRRTDSNLPLINTIENHFNEYLGNEFIKGDLFLFDLPETQLYHLAVYHDSNYLWHHPINGFPRKELFTPAHMNKVYKVYRYKDL